MNDSIEELRELGLNNKFVIELKKIKEGEKLPITSNTMFKTMITNENRLIYSAVILSQIISVDEEEILKNIKLIKNDLDKDNSNEKGRSVDFVARINNRIINIEMNNNDSYATLIRNIKYITDIYQGKLYIGDSYNEDEKAIQVNLNNFSYGEDSIAIEHYSIKSDERNLRLTKNLQIINIYLPKIIEKYYNNDKKLDSLTKLEKILLVMINKDINESKNLSKGDYIMEKFVEDSINATNDEIILGSYDKELDDRRIRNGENKEYFDKGIEEGAKSRNIEIAKSLLEQNISLDIIEKSTGLTKEEINSIAK